MTVIVECKWCDSQFKARKADIKRGWGKCCSKACGASFREFGYSKAYWTAQNSGNHISRRGAARSCKIVQSEEFYGSMFTNKADWDDLDDIDISDIDWGASDGDSGPL